MVTIHDVAKKANVSAATVSRVMNNGPVSARTRDHVLKVIRKLQYVPDSRATSLKRLKVQKIGLVVPDVSNPVYALTVKIVHDFLRANGYNLLLGITYGNLEEERHALDLMQRERVAGIILGTTEGKEDSDLVPFFERLIKSRAPMVFLGKHSYGLDIDTVGVDNAIGTARAAEYLLRVGKRHIGFLAGDANLLATQQRVTGFKSALIEHGLKPDPKLIVAQGAYTIENGEQLAERLLRMDPDAIVCGNDLLAIGAIQAAERHKLKIPEDVAIIGFDDIYLATVIRPRLTTIRQPFERILTTACEFLFRRIRDREPSSPERVLLEPDLVVRESA